VKEESMASIETVRARKQNLIFLNVAYLLSIFLWFAIGALIGMLGSPNHGGFGRTIVEKIIVVLHLSYPIVVLIALVVGWVFFYKGRSEIAAKVALVPLVVGLPVVIYAFMLYMIYF